LLFIITLTSCYGKAKQEWLETFLELPNGAPSHDTFGRVFSLISPTELQTCFLNWVKAIAELTSSDEKPPPAGQSHHGGMQLALAGYLPSPNGTVENSPRNPQDSMALALGRRSANQRRVL